VRNRALREFVEILSAARLAPKTIVNVVTVVKFVVASAIDEEGDQIHPCIWNHEFIQPPLVIKEKQNRPTINAQEISALLKCVKARYAVSVALVAGTGLRIGEALAVRTEDFDPACQVLHHTAKRLAQMRASAKDPECDSTRRYPGGIGTNSMPIHGREGWLPLHDESWTAP